MTELIRSNKVQEYAATQTADDDPILVCTFAIQVSARDEMASDLYFQRKAGTDSLWMEAEPRYRSESITAPTHGSKKSACKRLFMAHIRKPQRCESITRLISPGLLSASMYRSALREVFPDAAYEDAFMEGYPVIACKFWLSIIVDTIDAVLYFKRDGITDSVWVETGYDYGAEPITAPTRGSVKRACKRLFKEHIRHHGGYQFPGKLISPGLLSAWSYRSALKEVVHGLDEGLMFVNAAIASGDEQEDTHARTLSEPESDMLGDRWIAL